MNKEQGTRNNLRRKFKHGSYSVIITVIFLTAAILLNVVFGMLFGNFNLRFDLSERGLYSIEASTANYIAALDDTINFYFFSTEENFTNRGLAFTQVHEIAKRFSEANRNFTITFINRLTNPAYAAKFGGDLTDLCIVIESERTERFRVVRQPEYIVLEYFFNGERISEEDAAFVAGIMQQPVEMDVSAGAERAFLSAIMSVSDISPVRVAFTNGFGEDVQAASAMYSVLHFNGYLMEEIDLFTNAVEIDPEIDFIVIFAPAFDYTIDALRLLSDWLDNDMRYGKNLLYIPSHEMPETPNLDRFMADEWGLRAEYGFIIQDNDFFAFPGDEHRVAQFVSATGEFFADYIYDMTLFASAIRPITRLFETRPSMDTTPLVETYPGSFNFPFFEEADDREYAYEILDVVVMSRKLRFEGFEELTSRVIMFGSPMFFIGEVLAAGQFSNIIFLFNIFDEISGRDDITSQARIIPKSFGSTMFEITKGQADLIAIFFVIVIPLLIIAAGLVVFFRRRYR